MLHITLGLKVSPRCKKEGIFFRGDQIIVRVTEVPEKGRANDAVVDLLATTFGIPKREVIIVSGHTSKYKTVRLPREVLPHLEKLRG